VLVNFTKSGNHDSCFTTTTMISLKKAQGDACSFTSSLVSNDHESDDNFDDADDELPGVWRCTSIFYLPVLCVPALYVEKVQASTPMGTRV